jgi:hypothetical protein
MNSIICATILNDIFHCKVGTSQLNNNLMLPKVASQCPFVSATCVFSERGTNLVSNTRIVLVLHSQNIITIIPLIGRWDHIGVWYLINFVNACHHKSCHDLAFYQPLFFHLSLVHKMLCHYHG